MDCPYCKTYNPEDRTTCWRCDKPLPKPQPKKKPKITSQQWLYILVAVMFILMIANFCGLPKMLTGGSSPAGPTGLVPSISAATVFLRAGLGL